MKKKKKRDWEDGRERKKRKKDPVSTTLFFFFFFSSGWQYRGREMEGKAKKRPPFDWVKGFKNSSRVARLSAQPLWELGKRGGMPVSQRTESPSSPTKFGPEGAPPPGGQLFGGQTFLSGPRLPALRTPRTGVSDAPAGWGWTSPWGFASREHSMSPKTLSARIVWLPKPTNSFQEGIFFFF